MLRGLPVMRLSIAMTSWPSASSRSQRWEPRKPAPPVTRTLIGLRLQPRPTPGVRPARGAAAPSARRRCAGRPSSSTRRLARASPRSSARNSFHSVARTTNVGARGAVVGVARRSGAAGRTARAFSIAAGSKARTDAPASSRSAMTGSAGDSRMSSVSGLKERPRTATVLPGERPADRLDLLDHARLRPRVDADGRLDDLEACAVLAGDVGRRRRVLREAGAAEARARRGGTAGRSGCRGPCRAPRRRRRRPSARRARRSR